MKRVLIRHIWVPLKNLVQRDGKAFSLKIEKEIPTLESQALLDSSISGAFEAMWLKSLVFIITRGDCKVSQNPNPS